LIIVIWLEHTERLWLGTWNDDTISAVSGMEGLDQMVDFTERQAFRKYIKELTGPLRDLSPVILMARMEEITRKNSTLTNNVVAGGNRSGKKFRNVLTRAGFSIPRRKSTKKTECARPPGTVDDTENCLNPHWTRYRKTLTKTKTERI
jgi:hypothetical protein